MNVAILVMKKSSQSSCCATRLQVMYSEELAHLMYAAADMVLVPSLFEPCGLTQLVAMRYGAVPIVRSTGGLADTVTDVDDGRRAIIACPITPSSRKILFHDKALFCQGLQRSVPLYAATTLHPLLSFWLRGFPL